MHATQFPRAWDESKSGSRELTSSRAAAWVVAAPAPAKASTEQTTIKSGQALYAKMVRRGGQLVVKFADPDEASAGERALADFMRARAKEIKSKK